jgi:hypothetical protein
MYEIDLSIYNYSLTSSTPYSRATSLCTEFLLQVQKQWEDSVMILASTLWHRKENTENMEGKNEKTKQTHQEERTEHNRQKGVDKWRPSGLKKCDTVKNISGL